MAIEALLWVDLETTGSNCPKDCIIEVGAILTTPDLEVREKWHDTVEPTDRGLGRLLKNRVVREMHEKNGLLTEMLAGQGRTVYAVEKEILEDLQAEFRLQPKTVMLAGSGVGHFDRRFIKEQMPKLDNFLHYACLDVGVVRRMFQLWDVPPVGGDQTPNDRKTHRALDDIELHLEEARAYKQLFQHFGA